MSFLKGLSEEERLAIREKAKAARAEKQKAGENLKQDFLDESYWRALASKHGVRLPASYISNNEVKYLKRICTKLGIDIKEYLDYCACKSVKQLASMNPEYPAWVESSMLLEWYDEKGEV